MFNSWKELLHFILSGSWLIPLSSTQPQNRLIGLVGIVFACGPRDLGSVLGRVIPKILKMVLGTSLLNTQQDKVFIKGKVIAIYFQ